MTHKSKTKSFGGNSTRHRTAGTDVLERTVELEDKDMSDGNSPQLETTETKGPPKTIEEEYRELLELGKCIACQEEDKKCMEETKKRRDSNKKDDLASFKRDPAPTLDTQLQSADPQQDVEKVNTRSVGIGPKSRAKSKDGNDSCGKPKTVEEEYKELLEMGKCMDCQWQKNYHPCLMSDLKDNEKCIEAMRNTGYEYKEPDPRSCKVKEKEDDELLKSCKSNQTIHESTAPSRSSASHLHRNSKSKLEEICKGYLDFETGEPLEYINKLHPHADSKAHIVARDNLVPLPHLSMSKNLEKCKEFLRNHPHLRGHGHDHGHGHKSENDHGHGHKSRHDLGHGHKSGHGHKPVHGASKTASKKGSSLKAAKSHGHSKDDSGDQELLPKASQMQLSSEAMAGPLTEDSFNTLTQLAEVCRIDESAANRNLAPGKSVPTTTPSENTDIQGAVEAAIRVARKSLGGEPKKLILKGLNQKDEEGLILCAPVKPFAEMDEEEVKQLVIEVMLQAEKLELEQ